MVMALVASKCMKNISKYIVVASLLSACTPQNVDPVVQGADGAQAANELRVRQYMSSDCESLALQIRANKRAANPVSSLLIGLPLGLHIQREQNAMIEASARKDCPSVN